MKSKLQRVSLYLISGFYIFAGINHFVDPGFYYPLIPEWIPEPELINVIAGVVEIAFGIGFFSPKTRKYSSYGVIAMLFAFFGSHVYFIQIGSCIENGLCVPEWIGWARLLAVHPLLIYWAYKNRV